MWIIPDNWSLFQVLKYTSQPITNNSDMRRLKSFAKKKKRGKCENCNYLHEFLCWSVALSFFSLNPIEMSGFPTIKSHMTVICQDNGEQTTGIIKTQSVRQFKLRINI